jgi:protein TonB
MTITQVSHTCKCGIPISDNTKTYHIGMQGFASTMHILHQLHKDLATFKKLSNLYAVRVSLENPKKNISLLSYGKYFLQLLLYKPKLNFMEAKKILEADYLDIVFENRNKNYGSYELRKNYATRIKKAGLFALLGVASIVSFSFISSRHKDVVLPAIVYRDVKLTEVNTTKPPEPKPNHITPPPPALPTKVFVVPKIVTDVDVIDKTMATVADMHDAIPGTSNTKGDSSALGVGTSGEGTKPVIVTPPTPTTPMKFVEQMPQFNGDLAQYLSANIRYPENARSAGIQGRVVLQFVVDIDGSITEIKIVKSIGSGCDEEAVRVVSNMPKWKPGKNNGVAVKTYFNQAILFQLD